MTYRGLSAIVSRTVPHNMICYILGTTGEGRQLLRLHPGAQISYIDYVFIANYEDVRAWLLSNPVLDDILDLLVYSHRPESRGRLPPPPFISKKTRFCIHTHLNAPCSGVCIWSASCASNESSFKLQKPKWTCKCCPLGLKIPVCLRNR